jgi:hypothetical protein
MIADTPCTRTLRRAVGICGSETALARSLNVPVAALCGWLHGDDVPIEVYMKALDVVAGQRSRVVTEYEVPEGYPHHLALHVTQHRSRLSRCLATLNIQINAASV